MTVPEVLEHAAPTSAAADDVGRQPISAIITCVDSERHIAECIESLQWCDEILIVDSFSKDRTLEIASSFPKVRILQRTYYGSPSQKNWAMDRARFDWMLILDVDERCTEALRLEIEALLFGTPSHAAYTIRRRAWFLGKPIRFSGWQNDRAVRFLRWDGGRCPKKRVHGGVAAHGEAPVLEGVIEHYMVEDLMEYSQRLWKYAWWGAAQAWREGRRAGYYRIGPRSAWRFVRTYFLQLGFLDGLRGLVFCLLQAYTTYLKFAFLWSWRLEEMKGRPPILPEFDDDPSTWNPGAVRVRQATDERASESKESIGGVKTPDPVSSNGRPTFEDELERIRTNLDPGPDELRAYGLSHFGFEHRAFRAAVDPRMQEVLSPGHRLGDLAIKPLRLRLGRRTLQYRWRILNQRGKTAGSLRAVGKLMQPEAYELTKQGTQTLLDAGFRGGGDGISMPAPQLTLDEHHFLLQEWVAGRTAYKTYRAEPVAEHLVRVADVLAKLHRCGATTDRAYGPMESLAHIDSSPSTLAAALPELDDPIRRIVDVVHALSASMDELPTTVVHGDFHAKQVLLDGDRAWLLDFDRVGFGDPAMDVGNFLAISLQDFEEYPALDDHLSAFLRRYADACPGTRLDRLPGYVALANLRLACKQHRRLSENWKDNARRYLKRAIAYLEDGLIDAERRKVIIPRPPPRRRVQGEPRRDRPRVTFYCPGEPNLEDRKRLDPDRDWKLMRRKQRWLLQTYLRLWHAGLPVEISGDLPDDGIVIFHSKHWRQLGADLEGQRNLTLVGVRGDKRESLLADFELVQNGRWADGRKRWHIPYWPQPGLLQRDPRRGTRLERVAFKGFHINLHPYFLRSDWEAWLDSQGMGWQLDSMEHALSEEFGVHVDWHDYRRVDAVVAFRPSGRSRHQRSGFTHKPATKLVNAWLAGVPAVLGPEYAFRELRRSELDYLEIQRPEDARGALLRLRQDPSLYEAMVENGRERAREFSNEVITAQWEEFLYRRLPALMQATRFQRSRSLPLRSRVALRWTARAMTRRPER
ncbi:MAG: phosphotransferase [Planctomycetota bacterium]